MNKAWYLGRHWNPLWAREFRNQNCRFKNEIFPLSLHSILRSLEEIPPFTYYPSDRNLYELRDYLIYWERKKKIVGMPFLNLKAGFQNIELIANFCNFLYHWLVSCDLLSFFFWISARIVWRWDDIRNS